MANLRFIWLDPVYETAMTIALARLLKGAALAVGVQLLALGTLHAATVTNFTPQGSVAEVQQVRAIFSQAMVTLGDTSAPDPFSIACPMRGNGHWVDQRTWVWDMQAAEPSGQSCTFTLRDDLKTLSQEAFTGARTFHFSLPALSYNQRINISFMYPRAGQVIREDQRFLAIFDHPIQSPSPAMFCESNGHARQSAIILNDEETAELKKSVGIEGPALGLRCPDRFEQSSMLRLVLERGEGRDRSFDFRVRGPLSAVIVCDRITPQDGCLISGQFNLQFDSIIPKILLEQIRLMTPLGPVSGSVNAGHATPFWRNYSSVTFHAQLDPENKYKLEYPKDIADVDGRPIEPRALPTELATSKALAVVGFEAGRIAVVRRSNNPSIAMLFDHHPAPAYLSELIVGDESDDRAGDEKILHWLDVLQNQNPIIDSPSDASKATITEIRGDASHNVSLERPGLHVLTTAQALLADSSKGASTTAPPANPLKEQLDAGGVPERVAAFATSMSVMLKCSAENGAIWVTNLDDTRPLEDVQLRVYDRQHKLLWQGKSNAEGYALVPVPMWQDYQTKYTVIARSKDALGHIDISVTRSDWEAAINSNSQPGIFELWRYDASAPIRANSILDRTLFKPQERVSMRTVIRSETSQGLAMLAEGARPETMRITHRGSGQHWDVPLTWDRAGDAVSTFDVPASAPLGTYYLSLLLNGPGRPGLPSGTFQVQAYRIPNLTGDIRLEPEPVIFGSMPKASIDIRFQDGAPARHLLVHLSATLSSTVPFDNPPHEFRQMGRPIYKRDPFWPRDGSPLVLLDQDLTLDNDGHVVVPLPKLPVANNEYSLLLEATYPDSNGEVETITHNIAVHNSPWRILIASAGRGTVGDPIQIRVRTLDASGNPRINQPLEISAFYSQSYDNSNAGTPLGSVCKIITDHDGNANCPYVLTKEGAYQFTASARDEHGQTVESDVAVQAQIPSDHMKDLFLTADHAKYKPGDIAHILVQTPFVSAKAWLAVEREGVIESTFVTLTGPESYVDVPIRASYGPNVYVSLVAIPRGAELPVGRLPNHASGVVNLAVDPVANALSVNVRSDKSVYAPRQSAQLHIRVAAPDGGRPKAPVRATLVAVDEALLDLHDNDSWQLLKKMMQERPYGVATATPLASGVRDDKKKIIMELQQKLLWALQRQSQGSLRAPMAMMLAPPPAPAPAPAAMSNMTEDQSLDRVTLSEANLKRADSETPRIENPSDQNAASGGGASVALRRVISSLLTWQADIPLDQNGEAIVAVPLKDSLSRFRVVVVASAGEAQFGTGAADFVITQDIQISAGLAPVVRQGDHLSESITVRNRSARALVLDVTAKSDGLHALLPKRILTLSPGDARSVSWDITVPSAVAPLNFEFSALEQNHTRNGDRLTFEQRVDPATPITVRAAELAQVDPSWIIPVAAPPGSLPGTASVNVSLQASLAGEMPGVTSWMNAYPFNCIEQRTSIALATHNQEALDAVLSDLPKYLDADGLLNYFPTQPFTQNGGSDVLTSYLLNIAKAYDVTLPAGPLARMTYALTRFAHGRLVRHSWAPLNDQTARRLAAIAALSQYGKADLDMQQDIHVDVERWTTAMLIDQMTIAAHIANYPDAVATRERIGQQLRARVTYQGRRAVLSTEKRDLWFWLMQNGDVDTARLLLLVSELPDWHDDMPRLLTGFLARQEHGAWATTVANAWGVAAVSHFASSYEKEPVTGPTLVSLGSRSTSVLVEGARNQPSEKVAYPLGVQTDLKISHSGAGAPWATVEVRAAVPLSTPRYAGYRIDKRVTPVVQKIKGQVSVGDVYRVHLDIDAQSDSTWVAITDPVAAGASILGNGLGRDSSASTAGEKNSGATWPEFVERDYTAYRSFYRFVPRGKFSAEYTIRINNPGDFLLPPTRVEAMYAPDVFGETPNAALSVATINAR